MRVSSKNEACHFAYSDMIGFFLKENSLYDQMVQDLRSQKDHKLQLSDATTALAYFNLAR